MKLKTWHLLGLLLLSILIPMATVVSLTHAQEKLNVLKPESNVSQGIPDKCTPPRSEYEFENRSRVLSVNFTDRDGDTLYWKKEDTYGTHLGSFVLHPYTDYTEWTNGNFAKRDKDFFNQNFTKGKWGITYDALCFHVITATKL